MKNNLVSPFDLNQRLNKFLLLSSRQMSWKGILVEQYQHSANSSEIELPALSTHWLNLPFGHPVRLTQKHDDRLYERLVQKGDSIFIPAGQSSYWGCQGSKTSQSTLHIHLQPEFVGQIAAATEVDLKQIELVNHFAKQDLRLQHIAMLLLAELRSGGIMGQLYVESLTQVLVIHLLRYYAKSVQMAKSKPKSLTQVQLQHAIDYIHTHLDRELSLGQIAEVVKISPTYFASLFKRMTGIPPHQYVIQQRVERAKLLLSKTDLSIADIASRVGFSNQSHLTQQFKRFTGMTPKQIRTSA